MNVLNGVQTSVCVTCEQTTSILSSVTSDKSACVSCKPFIFAQSANDLVSSINCNQPFTSSAGFLIFGTVSGYDYTVTFGTESFTSSYLNANLQGSYLTCQTATRRNITSCQTLGNMCVLKLYASGSGASSNGDPCSLFNTIVSPISQQTTSFWPDNMPWLGYSQNLVVYRSSYDLNGIGENQYLTLKYDNR